MAIQHTWKINDKEHAGLLSPLKAIRQNCLDCSAGSVVEVKACEVKTCACYPFRFGRNPGKKRILSDEQRIILSTRLKNARDSKIP